MHSAAYIPLLAVLSGVHALPFSDASRPATTSVPAIVGFPAPAPYSTPIPGGDDNDFEPHHIVGYPAPERNQYPTAASITGVPAPYPTLLPPEYWTPTSPITAYPNSDNPTQRPPGHETSIHPLPSWMTDLPDPNNPTQRPPPYNTHLTGVPAPSVVTDPTQGPEPTTSGPTTGVPTASTTSEPHDEYTYTLPSDAHITGVPAPSTALPSNGTATSPNPSPTPEPPSCRPEWPTAGYTGTFRAAVIFVDFPDFEANTTIQELWEPISSYPAELFNTMSYGKLKLELVPLLDKFYRMPAESSSYGYARGLTTDMHLKYINDALKAVGTGTSFVDIDTLYIIPPKFANEISFSTSTAFDVTAPDGSIIDSSITFGQDLFFSWGPKTINHETGHAMGLPDLYPYDGGAIQQWVGGFDLMGVIGGQSPDYTAWHKWRLQWLEESQIACVPDRGLSQHRVSPIEVSDETRDSPKAIAIPINGTQYIMAEVRSELGINKGACGTGVLLYTADSTVGSGDGPIKVIDTKPNSGGCDASHGGELNDAPLKVGEEYDAGHGVIIRVKSQEWNDYIIEVERKE